MSKSFELTNNTLVGSDFLEEMHPQVQELLDILPVSVVFLGPDHKIRSLNATGCRFLGCAPEEVIGKHWVDDLTPSDLRDDTRTILTGLLQGESKITAVREGSITTSDCSRNQIIWQGSPLRNNSNQVVGVLVCWQERLSGAKSSSGLTGTISQYMAMIDAVPAMTYLKDADHKFVLANKAFCRFVGKPLEDITGKTASDLSGDHKAIALREIENQVMHDNREVIMQEEAIPQSDGQKRWISATVVPLQNEQGLVSGVVGMIRDVTDLHISRQQLVQADKLAAIGTLAAGVAHEINNPVGFICSNLNTMSKYVEKVRQHLSCKDATDSKTRAGLLEMLDDFADAVKESLDGTERVRKIVADLKSFSRVDKSNKEYFSVNEGLDSTLNIVWNELKYQCTVEKEYGDLPDLYCMSNQLNQVFMSLLVNAGQAIKGDSGRITIKTHADERSIYVSISDTGVGIRQENIEKVFEPFFTTKEIGKGTGLGLSVAYDIVKKHGGQIDITSEVGVGTEFTLTLPLEGIEHD